MVNTSPFFRRDGVPCRSTSRDRSLFQKAFKRPQKALHDDGQTQTPETAANALEAPKNVSGGHFHPSDWQRRVCTRCVHA